jgi:hypothetical protein
MRSDLRDLEKNLELDKASFTVQLQQQYDQVSPSPDLPPQNPSHYSAENERGRKSSSTY